MLNAGLVVPLVGASAKESNGVALGAMRTYAFIPPLEAFTYSRWIEAVRAGQTFVTNGPLLHFAIDDAVPRTALMLSSELASCASGPRRGVMIPFKRLRIVWNGEPSLRQ